MQKLQKLALGLFATAFGLTSLTAQAKDDFPAKPVTMICPWAAGGGTDMLARALAKSTEKYLGQPINVINTVGNNGLLGHEAIRNATPDGYTIGMITFELNTYAPQKVSKLTYKDYDLLMRLNVDPAALTVRADAPYNTVNDFVRYAIMHPWELTVGNSGPGSVWHLASGVLAHKAGIKLKNVPFEGAGKAVAALTEGKISAVTVSMAEVKAGVQSGQLKILGVMDAHRNSLYPKVPTMGEQGLQISYATWRGLALPQNVPAANRKKIVEAFKKGFESKEFKDYANSVSLNLAYQDSEEFTKTLARSYTSTEFIMQFLKSDGSM